MSRLRARTFDEVAATPVMIDRTERTFALKPKRLIADTAYGTGRFLGWLVKEKAITPHIPVWDMSKRKGQRLLALRLHLRQAAQPLYLPGRQDTDDDGPRRSRQWHPISRRSG
jgi:hypothetical protein